MNSRGTHPLGRNPIFGELPLELSENLRTVNPWWIGEEMLRQPSFHRWPFKRLYRLLKGGLTPAVVLRGPRRVGKTVLLRQIIQGLLAEDVVGKRILYVPFDELPTFRGIKEPILAILRWFEKQILGESLNQAANANRPAYILSLIHI